VQPPYPAQPWGEKTFVANELPPKCIQYSIFSEEVEGEEDW